MLFAIKLHSRKRNFQIPSFGFKKILLQTKNKVHRSYVTYETVKECCNINPENQGLCYKCHQF